MQFTVCPHTASSLLVIHSDVSIIQPHQFTQTISHVASIAGNKLEGIRTHINTYTDDSSAALELQNDDSLLMGFP